MVVLRALARLALNHFGYDVRRVASAYYVADPGSDPITFEYLPHRRGYVIFDIPIADARAFRCLSLPLRSSTHPFVKALKLAGLEVSEEAVRQTIATTLGHYYRIVCPASAADALGLSDVDAPGMADLPAPKFMLPWTPQSPDEEQERNRRSAVFEGLQYGVRARNDGGITEFGPVSPEKIALEVERLTRLLVSVSSAGFRLFDRRHPLVVAALHSTECYKWLIISGQHRFAMAAASGLTSLPAVVTEVIRREDAAYWPKVVEGVFTVEGALKVFDRIFDGIPAPVCEGWISGGE